MLCCVFACIAPGRMMADIDDRGRTLRMVPRVPHTVDGDGLYNVCGRQ